MKKTLILLATIAAAATAVADQVSSTWANFSTRNVQSISFTLGDIKGELKASTGSLWNSSGESDITPAWSNELALEDMNQDLGLTLTAANVMDVACSGDADSHSTLTLNFANTLYSGYTGTITLYFTFGQHAGDGPMSDLTFDGIDDAEFSYASYDGTGFNHEFSTGKGMSTLFKLTGVLVGDTLTISSGQVRNGFGMVAIKGIEVSSESIPEPTTATLSLLALAGLAARRRRK